MALPTVPTSSHPPRAFDRRSRRISGKMIVTRSGRAYPDLLYEMRLASGLTIRALAKRMGVNRESLSQYYSGHRGAMAGSRLSWFLRYADATGCRVYVAFPSRKEQEELVAKHGNPPDHD